MADFISKVQYKNCEDGEYFDEQPRNLKDTLELIANFPWAREQYADLALTGPSVTIQNDKGEYLRLGIYYGGKFTLHYLDVKNNYYKLQNLKMGPALPAVEQFFEGSFSPEGFERIKFASVTPLFTTNKLEYRNNLWNSLLLSGFWLIYYMLFVVLGVATIITKRALIPTFVFIPLFLLYPTWVLARTFLRLYRLRNQFLKIGRGNDIFLFGTSDEGVKSYNKNDIQKIVEYRPMSIRSPTSIEIYEIHFVNGSSICFTNVLISASTLEDKFSNKWKFPIEGRDKHGWKIIRSL